MYGLTADSILKLDKTEIRPDPDAKGRVKQHRYTRRSTNGDIQAPNFSYLGRVTVLPSVSATGDMGPSLFIFKGTYLPYRQVINGKARIETLSSHLPRGAPMHMRESVSSIDGSSL